MEVEIAIGATPGQAAAVDVPFALGVFAGMTTMPPAFTSFVSSPTVMAARPSSVNATSTYGCVCNGGLCPGFALTMYAENGAPCVSPTNSYDVPTNGSCSNS